MLSEKFPNNVLRYVAVVVLTGFFIRELKVTHYGGFVAQNVQELTSSQRSVLTTLGIVLTVLLLYMGGIAADKYGRKLTWAVSLFLYGGGMILLSVSSTFYLALAAVGLISLSLAFSTAWLAWIFDHENKEGVRNAYGLLRTISAFLLLAGILMAPFLQKYPDIVRHSSAAFGVISLVMGGWVITFPENYGNTHHQLIDIAKNGVAQVASSRVLQLLVVYAVLMGFPSTVSGFFWAYFRDTSPVITDRILDTMWIPQAASLLFAGIFVLAMRKTDYKKLIIYPLAFKAVFFALMPFVPSLTLFLALRSATSAVSLISGIGIIILVNDAISENRATCLSLMALLMSIPLALDRLWIMGLQELGWDISCVVASVCVVSSLFLLAIALKIQKNHEPEPSVPP